MDLSKGKKKEDEDPNEAAIREIKEETGLDIELLGEKKDFSAVKVLTKPFLSGSSKSLIACAIFFSANL